MISHKFLVRHRRLMQVRTKSRTIAPQTETHKTLTEPKISTKLARMSQRRRGRRTVSPRNKQSPCGAVRSVTITTFSALRNNVWTLRLPVTLIWGISMTSQNVSSNLHQINMIDTLQATVGSSTRRLAKETRINQSLRTERVKMTRESRSRQSQRKRKKSRLWRKMNGFVSTVILRIKWRMTATLLIAGSAARRILWSCGLSRPSKISRRLSRRFACWTITSNKRPS